MRWEKGCGVSEDVVRCGVVVVVLGEAVDAVGEGEAGLES